MRLGVRAYRTPFTRAITTARGAWTHREGAWVVVADAHGRVGLGEAAPLPAWGTEDLPATLKALAAAATQGGPPSPDPAAWGMDPAATPAAWFGLEMALLDLAAQRAGLPLASYLSLSLPSHLPVSLATSAAATAAPPPPTPATDPLSPVGERDRERGLSGRSAKSPPLPDPLPHRGEGDPSWGLVAGESARISVVPVNALLAAEGLAELSAEARAAVAAGFQAVKLKVGARALADDLARVRAVREAVGPRVRLRLDGNGGWDRETALRTLRAFAPFSPDYVEQPVAAGDLAGLVAVGRASGVVVAADEAAGSIDTARAAIAAGVPVLVLKAVALGGLRATATIAREAAASGKRVVLTSALDRGVATAGVLHLAAALGATEPSGLATGGFFATPALEGLTVAQGALTLPATPGLGFAVADVALKALIQEVRDAALADG
jgi:L-alanine-DL-glutamate epimerase-like enolase superfamily enzyme